MQNREMAIEYNKSSISIPKQRDVTKERYEIAHDSL